MSNVLLSDEVWSQLDPSAARLTRRDRWRVALVVLLVLVLGLLTVLGAAAGFFRPSISSTGNGTTELRRSDHAIGVTVELENSGMIDERLTGVGSNDPNLLVRATRLPFTIRSHHKATLAVQVTVRDCTRVKNGRTRIRITVDRLWWHLSRDVRLPDRRDEHGRWNAAAVCRS